MTTGMMLYGILIGAWVGISASEEPPQYAFAIGVFIGGMGALIGAIVRWLS